VQPLGQGAHALRHVAVAAQLERRGDVVRHRERGIVDELLVDHGHVALAHGHAGHIDAIGAHTAFGGHVQAGHDAHQAGLAGLRGTQQHGHRAAFQFKVHGVQPGLAAHAFADSLQHQFHDRPH